MVCDCFGTMYLVQFELIPDSITKTIKRKKLKEPYYQCCKCLHKIFKCNSKYK